MSARFEPGEAVALYMEPTDGGEPIYLPWARVTGVQFEPAEGSEVHDDRTLTVGDHAYAVTFETFDVSADFLDLFVGRAEPRTPWQRARARVRDLVMRVVVRVGARIMLARYRRTRAHRS